MERVAITGMLATVALATGACGGEARSATAATVRDSAGVQIVESSGPAWREGEGWRLSEMPAVDIGVVEGDPNYQLDQVTGATRMSDGRIAVANGGSSEIRFYDSTGEYLSTAGRKGGGPGEFERMGWFSRLAGDSLAVFDWNTRRLSLFDSAGKFVRSVALESQEKIGLASPIRWFGEGSLLAERNRLFGPGEERTGVIGDSMLYLRYHAAGKIADTLGFFPGRETYVQTGGSGKGSFVSVTMLPFGREPTATTHDGRMYFGASDRYEIGVYSSNGRLERLIRRPVENMAVTADDLEIVKRERLDRIEDDNWRRHTERMFAEMPFPKTMAAYGRLLLDSGGHLWVSETRRPADKQPRWSVFDPDGRLLGTSRSLRTSPSTRWARTTCWAPGTMSWTCLTCGGIGWRRESKASVGRI